MAYAPSKSKKNPGKDAEMPNLASMMDMMTIILLFLLKSLSSSGALLHEAPGITLPSAEKIKEAQQHIAFIINDQGIFEDIEGNIGNQLVTQAEMESDDVQLFTGLTDYLDKKQEQDVLLKREIHRIVTLQGDRAIKYKFIFKFIQSCGYSGFETIQFIVEKKSG